VSKDLSILKHYKEFKRLWNGQIFFNFLRIKLLGQAVGRAILKSSRKKGSSPMGIDLGLVVERVAVKKILHRCFVLPLPVVGLSPYSLICHPRLVHLAAAVPRDSPRPKNKNKAKSVNRGEIFMLKQYIISGIYYRSEYSRLYFNVLYKLETKVARSRPIEQS
jgi:hypothetical protein